MSWYGSPEKPGSLTLEEQKISVENVTDEHALSGNFEMNMQQRRRYTSRACAFCRSLHKKCDGGQPCVRCEQRKQECIYQKHKKRGPKPKSNPGRKSKTKRPRSLSTKLSNGRLKGTAKRRKIDEDYDYEEDEDYEECGNTSTKLEIVPREGEVQIWVVMPNSEDEVSYLFDPSLTIENVKQRLLESSAFGLSPHTPPNMVILSLYGEDRHVLPSTTLSEILDTNSDFSEIPIQHRTLIFTLLLQEFSDTTPVNDICSYRNVGALSQEEISSPSGPAVTAWCIPDKGIDNAFNESSTGVLSDLPQVPCGMPPLCLSMPCDVVFELESDPYFFPDYVPDLPVQHPEGWVENTSKLLLY